MNFESQESIPQPKWVEPDWQTEAGEIARTAEAFALDKYELLEACQQGKLVDLDLKDWNQLQNSDSRDPSWTLDEVHEHLSGKRDSSVIESGFRSGAEIPAPVILFRDGKPPYLIGGNSRLMMARALKITPKIWKVTLEN